MGKKRQIVRTRREVSRHFRVSERTVSTWIGRGMPGHPSNRGVPGRFDLKVIARWLKTQNLGPRAKRRTNGDSQHSRLDRLRADRIELEIGRERGDLVPLTPILNALQRYVGEAKSILESLRDRICAEVGDLLDDERRERLRAIVAEEVRGVLERVSKIPQGGKAE
ncbi:MAG: hypothetical protein ACYTG0_25925 [Planctomycetota bacterium]|jgi:phage terminase Nu1 subunit (DNA packaging protein)